MFVFPFIFLWFSTHEASLLVTHGAVDCCVLNQAGSFVLQVLNTVRKALFSKNETVQMMK